MAAEKNFENKAKKFLKEKGCWTLKTWSNGVQRSGVPDLLVCCNGYFLGVELKAPNGKPSELQIYNINKIIQTGGFGLILYPSQFEEFKNLVEYLFQNDSLSARAIETGINKKSFIKGGKQHGSTL